MTNADIPLETPVSWQVDGIDVHATLTYPKGDGPFSAMIMVAGSGPTDRNWNTPLLAGTNGSAALLASALTNFGYATLRYDKRASGEHAQDNVMKMIGKISMQGHMEELAGGVKLLADRTDIDPERIFALTNSEGCIHALNYQIHGEEPLFKGLILTSAPGRSVGAVGRSQIEAQVIPFPEGEKWLAAYDAAIANFSAGQPVSIDDSLPEGIRMLLMGLTAPMNQPFARELWITDPAELLAQVSIPVLVLIGKKDIQVNWQSDGAILRDLAKSHPNITVAFAENANHVLKYEPSDLGQLSAVDAAASYNSNEAKLDQESIEIIESWLAKQN